MNKDLILYAARKENEGILDEYQVEGWAHSFVVVGHTMRLIFIFMLLAGIIFIAISSRLKNSVDAAVLAAMMGAMLMLQLMEALIELLIYHNIKVKRYLVSGIVSSIFFLVLLGALIAMLIIRVK
ncbi:MAG: hypothetical protein IJP37_05120 [Clostridia bacterium]|nr:hypothetical protein [Clostridia bacterium]MBR0026524.1 hypothetical protein [Clostridia bacterium]